MVKFIFDQRAIARGLFCARTSGSKGAVFHVVFGSIRVSVYTFTLRDKFLWGDGWT